MIIWFCRLESQILLVQLHVRKLLEVSAAALDGLHAHAEHTRKVLDQDKTAIAQPMVTAACLTPLRQTSFGLMTILCNSCALQQHIPDT